MTPSTLRGALNQIEKIPKTFYTYLWLREDGTPYYAGKGCNKRAFVNDRHIVRCPPSDRIVIQEWPSEEDAFEAEKFLIVYYGRKDLGTGCLRNRTDGGEGGSGTIFSLRARQNMSKAAKNRPCLIAGRTKSLEECQKISISHMGIRPSKSAREKIGDATHKRFGLQKQRLAEKLGATVDELNLCQALSRFVKNRDSKRRWRKRAGTENIKESS
jgi:ribosomal protein L18